MGYVMYAKQLVLAVLKAFRNAHLAMEIILLLREIVVNAKITVKLALLHLPFAHHVIQDTICQELLA